MLQSETVDHVVRSEIILCDNEKLCYAGDALSQKNLFLHSTQQGKQTGTPPPDREAQAELPAICVCLWMDVLHGQKITSRVLRGPTSALRSL